jgi:hypothetical protein
LVQAWEGEDTPVGAPIGLSAERERRSFNKFADPKAVV